MVQGSVKGLLFEEFQDGRYGCHLGYQKETIFIHSEFSYCLDSSHKGSIQSEISNNVVCATSKGPDQPSLIRAFAGRLNFL